MDLPGVSKSFLSICTAICLGIKRVDILYLGIFVPL